MLYLGHQTYQSRKEEEYPICLVQERIPLSSNQAECMLEMFCARVKQTHTAVVLIGGPTSLTHHKSDCFHAPV